MPLRLALLWFSLLLPAARGAELGSVQVQEKDGRYTVEFGALIDATPAATIRLMLTPALWPQLSPIITEAKILASDPRGPRRVAITFHDCVFIFCKTVHKTEDITVADGGRIASLALPGQSDFSYAREDWHIYPVDGRTRIEYRAEMVPSFFVPPVIGPYILKARLRSMLNHTAANVEKLAEHARLAPQAPAAR